MGDVFLPQRMGDAMAIQPRCIHHQTLGQELLELV
jgi:hypothetical protein